MMRGAFLILANRRGFFLFISISIHNHSQQKRRLWPLQRRSSTPLVLSIDKYLSNFYKTLLHISQYLLACFSSIHRPALLRRWFETIWDSKHLFHFNLVSLTNYFKSCRCYLLIFRVLYYIVNVRPIKKLLVKLLKQIFIIFSFSFTPCHLLSMANRHIYFIINPLQISIKSRAWIDLT